MKRYKLLKDIPFAKAGDIVEMWSDGTMAFAGEPNLPRFNKEDVRMFPLWFEEIKEPKIFFTIDIYKSKFKEINTDYYSGWSALEVKNIKDLGLLFKTVEKTKKYLKYLKAKEIIKQDTKGFKPDWNNEDENRYRGCWDLKKDTTIWMYESGAFREPLIFFKSVKDIKESFEKHPNEWRTYLTYEQ